jgi:aldehyde dehydrogenase (NAD+)
MFIDGQWINSTSSDTFETRNSTTSEVLATFPSGTKADVIKAVKSAGEALPAWRRVPAPKRGEILLRVAQILRERKEEMGVLVSKEMGKIITEGRGDVQEAIDMIEYIAGEGRRLLGETTTSELPDKFCMTVLQSVGIVGLITPWNFPVAIPSWKLAPALIAGNTVVFKPSSRAPLCAAKLIEIFQEAGIPPGVINMVTGSGKVVGMEIVKNPEIKVISFTGGVDSGQEINSVASKYLKHVHLELGGKNPQIIMDDADLDLAVEGLIFGAFGTAGQRCTSTSRVIIHHKVYDKVIEKLIARAKLLKIGDPLDPEIDMGPVTSREQGKSILEYIKIGQDEGGKLLLGGHQLKGGIYDKGFYIEPTIFETKHGRRITKEEIFGPVLAIIKAKDYEDALAIANDVDYGLSSSIYTKNVTLAFKAIKDLEAGITYINGPTIGAEIHLPFGGIKITGNGGREAGSSAIQEFTEIKTVFIDYSNKLQKAQITE